MPFFIGELTTFGPCANAGWEVSRPPNVAIVVNDRILIRFLPLGGITPRL